MAQIPNTRALTEGDGLNDYFNVDTKNKIVSLPNGATLALYSDAYSTLTAQLGPGGSTSLASATTPDPGAGGTVNTAGIGRARVTPAANRTACILQAGTIDGQQVWVVNNAAANTIAWATAATSNIGGESGGTFVLAAKGAQHFVWDAGDSLWHKSA